MAAEIVSSPLGDLVGGIFARAEQRRAWAAWGIAGALGVHAVLAVFAFEKRTSEPPPLPPLLVELVAPEPPPPPAPPPEPPPPAAPESAAARAAAPAAPEPARAAALLTAKAEPTPGPKADEPVDFTNDPSVLGFGSGVVAVGGKAKVGLKGAVAGAPSPAGVVAAKPAGDGLTPLGNLSRKPSLGEADPCRGYFPSGAADDVASATVLLTIAKSGAVSSVQLLSESPARQGFGGAARACMSSKRFSPGLDQDGRPAATAIRVNVRFSR